MAEIRKRVGKRGTHYQVTVKRVDHPTQTATFGTKGEASVWAARVEAAIADGKHMPTAETKRRTVRELLERYKKTEIQKKRDQLNPIRYANFWIERIGDLKLTNLSRAKIVEIRDELALKKSAATVNRYLALLSHACTTAVKEWEWLETNPLRKVSRLSESTGRARYLSNDERERLVRAIREGDEYFHAIVLIALTAGARRGEILNLRWQDVNLSRGKATLFDTKNDDIRSIALVPQVIRQLKKLQVVRRIDSDRIFSGDISKHYHFERAWRDTKAAAEIKDFRFHDLRHSCASELAMNGATLAEIAGVLGHKTLQMVSRYSHLTDQHVHDIVERTALKVLGNDRLYKKA